MSEVIVFEDLWKIYSAGSLLEVAALKEINFAVTKGDFLFVLGPSGSGKTTLLNIAGLLDSPTKGKYFLFGRNFSGIGEREKAKIRNESIGFVFQQPSFLPEFTSLENVLMPAMISGKISASTARKANGLFERVGLEGRKNHFPSQLSGGELQRLTIIRALINGPGVILCDEPTGQLDERNSEIIMEILRGINRDFGTTVVFVTHNAQLTKGGKTVNLKDGKISA
ncbi:MAG: ABC transporter ATP-binding protein [Elusimicrobia bacterium]|nr:ABC transporter ATP-binding protein [Elusimicrobiota bacterium]